MSEIFIGILKNELTHISSLYTNCFWHFRKTFHVCTPMNNNYGKFEKKTLGNIFGGRDLESIIKTFISYI